MCFCSIFVLCYRTQYTHGKEVVILRKPDKVSAEEKQKRVKLGKALKQLREKRDLSLREVAEPIGIVASQLMTLESGANVPSPRVYNELVKLLKPSVSQRKSWDKLYSELRGTPPPDVCEIVMATEGMNDALRLLEGVSLTPEQLQELKETLLRFRPPDKGGGECDRPV